MDDQLGGGSLLDLARSHLRYVVGLLDEGRFTDSVERRLHRTAAELLRLCGWVSFDGAQQAAQAQRFFLAGLHAAHTAGDRALGANILGFMSCQAKDLGRPREAVTLAETARAGHRGGSPKVAAILDLWAAEAYANTGESAPCRAAIDAALERLTDPGPQHGEPDWCYWLDEAQANEQAGYSYLLLGEFPRARAHLRAALRRQEPAHSREGALRHTLLAATYLGQDDLEPERACHHGDRALDLLASQVDSARCAGHVRRLAGSLPQPTGVSRLHRPGPPARRRRGVAPRRPTNEASPMLPQPIQTCASLGIGLIVRPSPSARG